MVRGEAPKIVPKPHDGIWWVKVIKPRYMYLADQGISYWTWEGAEAEWAIARVLKGNVDWFGDDEGHDPFVDSIYASLQYRAIQLGPEINSPDDVKESLGSYMLGRD